MELAAETLTLEAGTGSRNLECGLNVVSRPDSDQLGTVGTVGGATDED